MTALEKFKKFRDSTLAKLDKDGKGGKGYFILDNKTCEAIVAANPLTLKDLGKIPGIKTGTKTFEKYGEAIVDYFTIASNF